MAAELVHATALAVGGRAALFLGKSGAGKSDLALRCLTMAPNPLVPQQAALIADDQVLIERQGAIVMASCPSTIVGRLEVRGLGIVRTRLATVAQAPLALIVQLAGAETLERLPDPWPHDDLLGVSLPVLYVHPFEASAPVKVLLALTACKLPFEG